MTAKRIVHIRRQLTGTPLARLHERVMDGRSTHKRIAIPWRRFDRTKYPEGARALAAQAQTMLATGEYGAVGLFSQVATALALHGAPFDLVSLATRIPTDEIRHADYAIRFASVLMDQDVSLSIDRAGFDRRFSKPLEREELDFVMADVAAVSETLAAALLSACRERATDPVAQALFATIVSDEVHHARLGWYYLAWRAPQWTMREKQRLADRLGSVVMGVERRFWRGRDAPAGCKKAARALGVLESAGQREAVKRVMEEEIVPALDAVGLGASHAWKLRHRGA